MSFTTAPFPTRDPLVTPAGFATKPFIEWVSALTVDVDAAPARVRSEVVSGQTATLGTTPFAAGSLSAGLYRISYHARITTAATVSSSLTPTVSYTVDGLSVTQSGTAITGNTPTTAGSGAFIVKIDGGTAISYGATYASVGATSMVWAASFVLEQVDA